MDLEQITSIAEDLLKGDPSPKQLASKVETTVTTYLNREGFARKTLQKKPLSKGEEARVRIRKKDVEFSPAGGRIEQDYAIPAEFTLTGSVAIPDIESVLDPIILAEKIVDLLESSLIKEDQAWKKLADQGVTFAGSPQNAVADMKAQGITPAWWIASTGFLTKLATETDVDPVTKRKLVEEGTLPKIYGAKIHTDAHREPHLQVLGANDIYLVGSPVNLGVRAVRKEFNLEMGAHPEGRAETVMTYTMIEGLVLNKLAIRKLQ